MKNILNAKGMILMKATEIKEILITIVIAICITVMACLRIVDGNAVVGIMGLILGYVFKTADNKIGNKNK